MSSRVKTAYVVEDDPNIQRIMALKAKSLHFDVECFDSGDAAIEAIAVSAPDLVLTDYRMPGNTDGVQLIRKIRDILKLDMPIILVTGSLAVMSRLKETLADLSDIEYVAKPFSPRALGVLIVAMLEESASTSEGHTHV